MQFIQDEDCVKPLHNNQEELNNTDNFITFMNIPKP